MKNFEKLVDGYITNARFGSITYYGFMGTFGVGIILFAANQLLKIDHDITKNKIESLIASHKLTDEQLVYLDSALEGALKK